MEASRLAAGMEATAKDWADWPDDPEVERAPLVRWFVARLTELLGGAVARTPAAVGPPPHRLYHASARLSAPRPPPPPPGRNPHPPQHGPPNVSRRPRRRLRLRPSRRLLLRPRTRRSPRSRCPR